SGPTVKARLAVELTHRPIPTESSPVAVDTSPISALISSAPALDPPPLAIEKVPQVTVSPLAGTSTLCGGVLRSSTPHHRNPPRHSRQMLGRCGVEIGIELRNRAFAQANDSATAILAILGADKPTPI